MAEQHGMTGTRIYRIWQGMLNRCHNDHQGTYGKKGVTVCAEWEVSFSKFYEDMGDPPSTKHSIDRINTKGNYEPSNCRWATRTEQARNTTTNTFLSLNGESKTIAEWSEITGIKPTTICVRLAKGMSHEEALTTPVQAWRIDAPWKAEGLSRSEWYRRKKK
jgi:hypothetical protein